MLEEKQNQRKQRKGEFYKRIGQNMKYKEIKENDCLIISISN